MTAESRTAPVMRMRTGGKKVGFAIPGARRDENKGHPTLDIQETDAV